jgi:hypothetical protein
MRKETGAKGARPASDYAYQGCLKETLTRVARIAGEIVRKVLASRNALPFGRASLLLSVPESSPYCLS